MKLSRIINEFCEEYNLKENELDTAVSVWGMKISLKEYFKCLKEDNSKEFIIKEVKDILYTNNEELINFRKRGEILPEQEVIYGVKMKDLISSRNIKQFDKTVRNNIVKIVLMSRLDKRDKRNIINTALETDLRYKNKTINDLVEYGTLVELKIN